MRASQPELWIPSRVVWQVWQAMQYPASGGSLACLVHSWNVGWLMQVYTIYSILFIVFIILIIVTAFITVALTYFQLAVEDHAWFWRSFLCGGSTGAAAAVHAAHASQQRPRFCC